MNQSSQIAHEFYQAFQRGDGDAMAQLYHPEAHFSDPVFKNLNSGEAGKMWQMFCRGKNKIKVEYGITFSQGNRVGVRWVADYHFSKTGRKVNNIIDAILEIKDGKIIKHGDRFNLWRWSWYAFGPVGVIAGWTPFFQAKIRSVAAENLSKFCKDNKK